MRNWWSKIVILLFFVTIGSGAEAGFRAGSPGSDDLRTQIPGWSWVIVYSRPTLGEAVDLAKQLETDWPSTSIFQSQNGWYAISIGTLRDNDQQHLKDEWIATGRIPDDSFLSSGEKLVRKVILDGPTPQQGASYSGNGLNGPVRLPSGYETKLQHHPSDPYKYLSYEIVVPANAIGFFAAVRKSGIGDVSLGAGLDIGANTYERS